MAVLPIRKFGDPVLRETSAPVEQIDHRLRDTAKNMAATMYEAHGIGLAAPQVGILRRVIVVDLGDHNFVVYVNPEISEYSKETETEAEGCLCLPDIRVPVRRAMKIKFKAQDLKGRPVTIEAKDLLARVLQHEVDHLQGKTILDRTEPEEKKRALTEYLERTKEA